MISPIGMNCPIGLIVVLNVIVPAQSWIVLVRRGVEMMRFWVRFVAV